MIKMILKQLWNQRRQNGWILLELIAITYFLFTLSVAVVRVTAQYMIPDGYEKEKAYIVTLRGGNNFRYSRREGAYRDSVYQANFNQLLLAIKSRPEVEAVAVVRGDSYPGAASAQSNGFVSDDTASIRISSPWYQTNGVKGADDFLKVYDLKDARTGKPLQLAEATRGGARGIVSASFARQLFGRLEVVGEAVHFGKKMPEGHGNKFEIVGVYEGYKRSDFHVPGNTVFLLGYELGGRDNFYHTITFRLKEGVDGKAFRERLMTEVAPAFENSPTAIKSVQSFGESLDWFNGMCGIYSQYRFTFVMAFFVLLCVFLGMTGTFWIRCRTRRQEIGLMRSIGASQGTIGRQFVTEAWLLVSIGFLVAQPLIIHYIHAQEMSVIDPTAHYWHDSKVWLTLVTDAVVYLLMLAIALVGTWLPVHNAARELPAEALKDE